MVKKQVHTHNVSLPILAFVSLLRPESHWSLLYHRMERTTHPDDGDDEHDDDVNVCGDDDDHYDVDHVFLV